jgi:hypothetical protein
MNRIFRSAFVSLFAVGVAASLSACKVDCDTEDGTTKCEGENLKPYVGTTITKQAPVADGQRLTISVTGANVRLGDTASVSINVNPDGARPGACADAAQLCIQFIPINSDTADRVDEVTRQMKQVEDGGNLITRVGTDANGVLIEVLQDGKNGKYNTALSATVQVWAPASFSGDIVANSATGDISVRGARRAATVTTGLGDIAFDLSAITPGASGGEITSGNGDITFNLPGTANLNVTGDARGAGGVVSIAARTGWQEIEGSTTQAATFCGNTACSGKSEGLHAGSTTRADWALKTELGSILITLL